MSEGKNTSVRAGERARGRRTELAAQRPPASPHRDQEHNAWHQLSDLERRQGTTDEYSEQYGAGMIKVYHGTARACRRRQGSKEQDSAPGSSARSACGADIRGRSIQSRPEEERTTEGCTPERTRVKQKEKTKTGGGSGAQSAGADCPRSPRSGSARRQQTG